MPRWPRRWTSAIRSKVIFNPPLALSLSKGISAPGKERDGLRRAQPERVWTLFLCLLGLFLAFPAQAQEFPKPSGPVVDAANLLSPADEAALMHTLAAQEQASTRQLAVDPIPALQDYPIEEYGYRHGRAWGLGQAAANNQRKPPCGANQRQQRRD